MKFILLQTLFLCLLLSNAYGLELLEELLLPEIAEIDYAYLQQSFDDGYELTSAYDYQYERVFITLPTKDFLQENKTDNTIELYGSNKTRKIQVSVFDSEGKFLQTIGKHGSYAQEGYNHLLNLEVHSNEIFLLGTKPIAYDREKLNFLYNIDSSSPENKIADLLIRSCNDSKCYGEQPIGFSERHYNSAFRADMSTDPSYPETKILTSQSNFFDVDNYVNSIFENLEKYAKVDTTATIKAFVSEIWSEGIYVTNFFAQRPDNSYFHLNGYATDLLYFDSEDLLLDSLHISEISNIRKNEIANFSKNHKPKNKITFFSKVTNLFTSEEGDYLFISIRPSELYVEEYEAKRLLTIYSIKDHKLLLPLTPIDFFPVSYSQNILTGLKVADQKISLNQYEVGL